ncbi:unnamed protein product [Cercopithifilaria johnstoni]|uniref:CRAL-TRIO domain-containing protein n=1 Tax=Cercopithifilaria johnstoni TaxID=2874296 RepID=A0A8J2Q3P2_9BILA|nr:unnamed protein product [Cercopithifilaria johnstoni]
MKSSTYFTPSPITEDEIIGAEKIREIIDDIPDLLNTTYYLARWWRAYNGDLERIKRNMKDLFDHRRTFAYDDIETHLLQTKLEIPKKTFERFCISKIALYRNINNVYVFFQRMVTNDIDEICRVVPFSHVLHSYFIMQEAFTRAQLEAEKATGKPAVVVSILDLSEINTTALLNPLSVSAHFVRLIVKIWADYFVETQAKLFLVNSPALLSIMGQIVKLLVDKTTQSRLQFLNQPTDLMKHLNPYLVPAIYGGEWCDNSGYAEKPELVCQKPIKIEPEHYYNCDLLWQKYGFPNVPPKCSKIIKRKQTFEIKKICTTDSQILLWHFIASTDVEFSIVKIEMDNEQIVWPKITLTSLRTPEQGSIICKHNSKYILRFTNPGKFLVPVRLQYAIELCSIP